MPCSGCGAWVDEWITWRRCDCQSMWIAWPPLRLSYTCFLGITRRHYLAYYFYCSRCVIENRCNARQPTYINSDGNARTDSELEEEITRVVWQLEDLIGVWRDNKRSTYRISQGHQGLDVTTFRPNGKVIFTRGLIYVQAGSCDIVWGKTCGRTYTLLSVDHSVVIWARSAADRFTWNRVPEPSTPAFSHEGTAREPIGISNLGAAEVGVGSCLVMLRSKFNMSVGDICRVVGETASQNSWQVATCYNRERLSVLKNHEDVSWRWVN